MWFSLGFKGNNSGVGGVVWCNDIDLLVNILTSITQYWPGLEHGTSQILSKSAVSATSVWYINRLICLSAIGDSRMWLLLFHRFASGGCMCFLLTEMHSINKLLLILTTELNNLKSVTNENFINICSSTTFIPQNERCIAKQMYTIKAHSNMRHYT